MHMSKQINLKIKSQQMTEQWWRVKIYQVIKINNQKIEQKWYKGHTFA